VTPNRHGSAVIEFPNDLEIVLTRKFANLDDGDVWPVSYALKKWSPMVAKKVTGVLCAGRVRSPAPHTGGPLPPGGQGGPARCCLVDMFM
jgi:hypothetical protein